MPQPLLHDLQICVAAPTQAWTGPDGQIRATGAQGIFHSDVRVLSAAVLTVNDREPEPISINTYGADALGVIALARALDGAGPDPTFRVDRRRTVFPGGMHERITVTTGGAPARARVRVTFACDLAPINAVKAGEPAQPIPAHIVDGRVQWRSATITSAVSADGEVIDGALDGPAYEWRIDVGPGEPAVIEWHLEATDAAAAVAAPATRVPEWSAPVVVADDRRVSDLLTVALSDLAALRLATAEDPGETFLAAGAPWFFTLFGRDSLWAARFLLPLGTDLAASTLRVLASRQGQRVDIETAEEPGKILHEVRRDVPAEPGEQEPLRRLSLPPVYYGTVDATPLWICLLHDAWRWGMPEAQVRELLPSLRAALTWMSDYGDADGDGLLEYVDHSGRGLTNQGWKDSGDAVQWRDGSLARAPIALAEVQAYAYEAATVGAVLLDALGDGAADSAAAHGWRAWAARLATQFRAGYWVPDAAGAYPAIALDADKRAVDTLTSNIGHLLGTGLLDGAESALVAQRLMSPALSSGFGVRTLSTEAAGYWPLRYHGGTVWTHDTAIAILGLARAGFGADAARLASDLLEAAPGFGFRMPELFGGDARGAVARPTPYPASCRPQAWSAASAVALLTATLGLEADAPAARIAVRPATPGPFGALQVTGLQLAGAPLDLEVDAAGVLRSSAAPPGFDVITS